jgi:L-ascorbate metabolism protein UlaG (beta-lactamase superfamily)
MLAGFTWFKQSGYCWRGDGLTVYIDPWEVPEDQPSADAIFITHAHFDHYSPDDLARLAVGETVLVAPQDIARELSGRVVAVSPGDTTEAGGVKVQAVPAYNIVEGRLDNHPKGNGWVGYILELGAGPCTTRATPPNSPS